VARCHHRIKDHLGRAKRAAGWVQRVFQAADKHAENTARDPTEVGVPIARTLEARRLPFRRPAGVIGRLNHIVHGKVPSSLLRASMRWYLGLPSR
jgi:hypothetical protein